jgi:hypothetical protein
MIASINETIMKLVNRELLIFKHYEVDVKNIKCPLQWWENYENMFSIVEFRVRQILGVVESKFEIDIYIYFR